MQSGIESIPTVLRKDGFRVVIYFDDHLSCRVHILNAESEVKIGLGGKTEQPTVLEYRGDRRNAVKALQLVVDHQFDLLEAWRQIHGGV